MHEDFQEVLVGCRAQDPKSLNKFIVGIYSTLFTTARKWLGDEDRAKDAVQSFFLHFLEKGLILQFGGTRSASYVTSWLSACGIIFRPTTENSASLITKRTLISKP